MKPKCRLIGQVVTTFATIDQIIFFIGIILWAQYLSQDMCVASLGLLEEKIDFFCGWSIFFEGNWPFWGPYGGRVMNFCSWDSTQIPGSTWKYLCNSIVRSSCTSSDLVVSVPQPPDC